MKYVISTFILGLVLVPSFVVNAQIIKDTAKYFDISTIAIDRLEEDEDTARFVVDLNNMDISKSILYWKVRLYCEEGVTLNISGTDTDECGTAVTLNQKQLDSFTLLFKTQNDVVSNFSFALKAYDAEGDWLQTERRNFSWK